MSVFVRNLVLCNALLLVLPQGWCCLVPLLAPCAKETPAKTKGCSHCAASKGHDHSVPTPAAPKPLQKCCFQLDSLIGPSLDKFQPVLMLALLPRITIVVPTLTNYTEPLLLPYPHFDPPLHLLHCLWLC